MRGAPETAANLFRLLLSLDPHGDPCGVLLRLDADLLAAEQYDAVLELHGANLQVAALPAALASAACPLFDDPPRAAKTKPAGRLAPSTTALLPGLCLNRGLALLRLDRRSEAVRAVAEALSMFPHLLACVLDACGVDADRDRSTNYDFRELLWHDHFRAKSRDEALQRAFDVGALPVALDAACLRGRHLWRAPDALRLLHDGAAALARRLGPGKTSAKTLAVVDKAWATSALAKYAAVPVEEFADGFPQLGPEAAEGFDEANLSPDAAREAARQAQGPVRLARGQRGAVTLEDLLDRLPPELRADFAAQLDAGVAPEDVQDALLALMA